MHIIHVNDLDIGEYRAKQTLWGTPFEHIHINQLRLLTVVLV